MRQPIVSDVYVPAPLKPDGFDAAVTRLRGYNPLGEPQWRVVWGMDQFIPMEGNPRAPKYGDMTDTEFGPACWLLEGWRAPEFFGTPEDWEDARYGWEDGKRVEYLRDYPNRGEYWLIKPIVALETGRLCMVQLGPATLTFLEHIKKGQDEFKYSPSNVAMYGKKVAERAKQREAEKAARSDENADIVIEDFLMAGDNLNRAVARGGMIADVLGKRGPVKEFPADAPLPSEYQLKTNPESLADAQKFLKAQDNLLGAT